MGRRYVSELKPGETLDDQVFLIRSKDLRTTTQGSLYIHAVLADRTGQLLARAWQASEEMYERMPEGGFLRFKGRTENYKGNLQFIIEAIRPVDNGSVDVADFLPRTTQDVETMFTRVKEILGGIKQPDLARVVQEFLADRELMEQFQRAPAASNMHHAFIGGLLEHTLSLLELGLRVMPLYPKLSMDLVLAGLFLHDIGKTQELAYATSIGYSDEGQLLGHITQAVVMIDRKARALAARTGKPVNEQVLRLLQHIIVSHHGKYEFGSPKLPAIPEAFIVHYLDNLDAKVAISLGEIENDKDPNGSWTNFNRGLETKLYKVDVLRTRGCS